MHFLGFFYCFRSPAATHRHTTTTPGSWCERATTAERRVRSATSSPDFPCAVPVFLALVVPWAFCLKIFFFRNDYSFCGDHLAGTARRSTFLAWQRV